MSLTALVTQIQIAEVEDLRYFCGSMRSVNESHLTKFRPGDKGFVKYSLVIVKTLQLLMLWPLVSSLALNKILKIMLYISRVSFNEPSMNPRQFLGHLQLMAPSKALRMAYLQSLFDL